MLSEREQFCAALVGGPLYRGDVAVVLCGEDAEMRKRTVLGCLLQQAAPRLLLTGALDDPPRLRGAERVARELICQGVAPDRIETELTATNTWEQATRVVARFTESGPPGVVLLIASAYHQYRAALTFIQALHCADLGQTVRLIPVPAPGSWWEAPEGMAATRLDLLADEFTKIEEYRLLGHVASYADGLAYLRHWEGAPRDPA